MFDSLLAYHEGYKYKCQNIILYILEGMVTWKKFILLHFWPSDLDTKTDSLYN